MDGPLRKKRPTCCRVTVQEHSARLPDESSATIRITVVPSGNGSESVVENSVATVPFRVTDLTNKQRQQQKKQKKRGGG